MKHTRPDNVPVAPGAMTPEQLTRRAWARVATALGYIATAGAGTGAIVLIALHYIATH